MRNGSFIQKCHIDHLKTDCSVYGIKSKLPFSKFCRIWSCFPWIEMHLIIWHCSVQYLHISKDTWNNCQIPQSILMMCLYPFFLDLYSTFKLVIYLFYCLHTEKLKFHSQMSYLPFKTDCSVYGIKSKLPSSTFCRMQLYDFSSGCITSKNEHF